MKIDRNYCWIVSRRSQCMTIVFQLLFCIMTKSLFLRTTVINSNHILWKYHKSARHATNVFIVNLHHVHYIHSPKQILSVNMNK